MSLIDWIMGRWIDPWLEAAEEGARKRRRTPEKSSRADECGLDLWSLGVGGGEAPRGEKSECAGRDVQA